MGLAEGLLQPQLGYAIAELRGGAHLQIAALLQGNQLNLASGGRASPGGRHRRNNR